MKKIFLTLFTLISIIASAHDFVVDGIYYNINGDEAIVTYRGSSYNEYSNDYTGEVVIPETVSYNGKNYPVTTIGKRAFWECSKVTNVNMPNSITCVDSLAFYECYGLTSFTIPNSTISIEYGAFWLCTGLTSIEMGNSLVSIGDNAFHMCRGLTNVTIGKSVTSIGKQAFICCTSLTSVNIGNSVTSIGGWAFQECSALTNVSIGNSVASMGEGAFAYCNRVKNLTWNAKNCSSLGSMPSTNIEQVTIGSEVEVLPAGFVSGSKITEVMIPSSVITIGNSAFSGCTGLTSVIIPDAVTGLGEKAFNGCTGLTSITIGNSVTDIASSVFKDCSSLTGVIIPNSVTSIGFYAFSGCSELTNIIIPNSITLIGYGAFRDCSRLESITIPNSVTTIGDAAFSSCTGLTSVNISDIASWCHIDFDGSLSNPLYYSRHLYLKGSEVTDLEIPNIVTKIGNYAFFYCNNIKSVSIPNSVTFIGCNAFQYCTYLSNVTIPSSVTSIGNKAFDHCYALKNVTIPNSVTYFGESVFNYCYAISSLMITGDGEWQAGAIDCSPNYLYIDSKITAVHGIKINPKTHVYSYASTPPDCDENSFTNYSGTLHVPATSVAAYFVAEYWSNFGNIVGDAVEPHIKISSDSVEVNLGDQFKLTATITPENACPQTVTWRSTNPTIATVNSNGTVTAVSAGNCDIIVECIYKSDTCHVVVKDTSISIMLDQQEAMLLPNHILILKPIPNPIVPDLVVSSSDATVAAARVVDGKIQVVGIKEGSTTITVGSADGTAIPATCEVTVYTEPGDLDCDGYRNISDVTTLIDYLLSGNGSQISLKNADVDGDGKINISDVTTLIDILLRGA